MDPLTHLVAPAAAAVLAGGGRRGAVLAGVGGLLPDVEKAFWVLCAFLPGSDYLLFREGGTHTLAGAALLALSAALFLGRDRARAYPYLLLGTVSHVLLDVIQTPWGVRPFLPLSGFRIERRGFAWEEAAHVALLVGSFAVLLLWWRIAARRQPSAGELARREDEGA